MALGPGTSPIPAKKLGPQSFPTIFPNTTLSPDSDSALLTITVPENILHEVDIDLAMGYGVETPLSLDELDGLRVKGALTVFHARMQILIFTMGGCHIDHLSAPEFDAELAMGDCTIGMLSGAQDVSISVTLGKAV